MRNRPKRRRPAQRTSRGGTVYHAQAEATSEEDLARMIDAVRCPDCGSSDKTVEHTDDGVIVRLWHNPGCQLKASSRPWPC